MHDTSSNGLCFFQEPEEFDKFEVSELPLFWITQFGSFKCNVTKRKDDPLSYFSFIDGIMLGTKSRRIWYHELGHYLDLNLNLNLDKSISFEKGKTIRYFSSLRNTIIEEQYKHFTCYRELVAEIFSAYMCSKEGLDIAPSVLYVNAIYYDEHTLNLAFSAVENILFYIKKQELLRLASIAK